MKGYQAPTYSMSRKNSVKVLDTSKSSGHFKSFLKKPTNIHNRNTRLRTAKSNDTINSGNTGEKSFGHHFVPRKRKKQPSESIDSNSRN